MLDLSLKGIGNGVKYCRQNTSILKDHTFVSYFNTEFRYFLSINAQSTDDPTLLWETMKAYTKVVFIHLLFILSQQAAAEIEEAKFVND